MRFPVIILLAAGTLALAVPEPAEAAPGTIERACRQSDRPAATRARCGCIQRVANDTLSRTERRKVAKWFDDPHQAQVVRMSDRRSDEVLWERYKRFGELAQAICE